MVLKVLTVLILSSVSKMAWELLNGLGIHLLSLSSGAFVTKWDMWRLGVFFMSFKRAKTIVLEIIIEKPLMSMVNQ